MERRDGEKDGEEEQPPISAAVIEKQPQHIYYESIFGG